MNLLALKELKFPISFYEEIKYSYEFLKKSNSETKNLAFDFTVLNIDYGYKDDKPTIRLNRQSVFLNQDYLEETLIGELLEKCSQVLFPLDLTINKHGYFKELKNYLDILQRWKNLKPILNELYQNKVTEKLIQKIENLYGNENKLLESLQKDWFFTSAFFPFYGNYGDRRSTTIEYYFPLNSSEKILYEITLNLQDVLDEEGKTVVLINGKSTQSEANTILGYILLNEDRTLHELKFNFNLPENQESINIKISQVV